MKGEPELLAKDYLEACHELWKARKENERLREALETIQRDCTEYSSWWIGKLAREALDQTPKPEESK